MLDDEAVDLVAVPEQSVVEGADERASNSIEHLGAIFVTDCLAGSSKALPARMEAGSA